MMARGICEEDVEPAGFLFDNGPTRLTKRSQPAPIPPLQAAWMRARLAARFPEHFLPGRITRLIPRKSEYARLQALEDAWLRDASRLCGRGYGDPIWSLFQRCPEYAEVASRYGAPYRVVDNINSAESVELLRSWRPDFIVSLGDRIIREQVLAIPTAGVLNGHSSLLPRFRGSATEFWQLAHGEKETGVTIHFMSPNVDEGAIVTQERWPIPPGTNHWQLRTVSTFLRLPVWRRAIRLACAGEKGIAQSRSNEPTFGRPDLRNFYDYYIAGRTLQSSIGIRAGHQPSTEV
jgi:folate-dependent phosphoribosylglycinamide formyltransferase PurN